MDLYGAAERFVEWLETKVILDARGDLLHELEVDPNGRFWLGRLAPEGSVIALGLGDRGERLDPCAIGLRIRPAKPGPWSFAVRVRACAWSPVGDHRWHKSRNIDEAVRLEIHEGKGGTFGREQISHALAEVTGGNHLNAEIRVDVHMSVEGRRDLTITLVNTSPGQESNLYECSLEIGGIERDNYVLESLPDSFRYDRNVPGYGINCGLEVIDKGGIRTTDAAKADRSRPTYWNVEAPQPDLSFRGLASDALPVLEHLLTHLRAWGATHWSHEHLRQRSLDEGWSPEMLAEAISAAGDFDEEVQRVRTGIDLLRHDEKLLRAFRLMNRSMIYSSRGKYDSWRPFQVGFLIANLRSIADPSAEENLADVVWFATGGGKTETYLGLLVTASFHDRLRGKRSGITAWSRFPLRMLSLQQTQRFADAMAGAERIRREESISGEPFGIGFLVGEGATPNRIPLDPKEDEPDPEDEAMPARYQVLSDCPFCHSPEIEMNFDRATWRLEHRCKHRDCPWPEKALPFYVVDEEIFRFLPTILVGTLDKAASIGLQAAMRGLVGPPFGLCPMQGHGYTYASRSKRPNGCLSPGCISPTGKLDMPPHEYGPSFRLQDELHLLRDSLGAVDSHYETLFDHLESTLCGRRPKILASSATLTGYENQVEVLYNRKARVFPVPGPSVKSSFWTSESGSLARRFVALAPRGVTLEFAVDRTLTELQRAVRRLEADPEGVCHEIGVPKEFYGNLLSLYGVDLVYGNTLRDLDAAVRSMETQIEAGGALNSASLTGKTDFEEVRQILQRLDSPEESFSERLHLIAASSMMSHGVDVDRLNVMLVLGLPLTTAEFIQATARVGRKWPGLVFVMHKIARERDAGVYRSFGKFIEQGDRFVEAIPITRRSRRVLEKTLSGLVFSRILAVHEPSSKEPLTTIARLRNFFEKTGVTERSEIDALLNALALDRDSDELMVEDLEDWLERFFRRLRNPGGSAKFPQDVSPTGAPMRSLRDVEEQVPIFGRSDR